MRHAGIGPDTTARAPLALRTRVRECPVMYLSPYLTRYLTPYLTPYRTEPSAREQSEPLSPGAEQHSPAVILQQCCATPKRRKGARHVLRPRKVLRSSLWLKKRCLALAGFSFPAAKRLLGYQLGRYLTHHVQNFGSYPGQITGRPQGWCSRPNRFGPVRENTQTGRRGVGACLVVGLQVLAISARQCAI